MKITTFELINIVFTLIAITAPHLMAFSYANALNFNKEKTSFLILSIFFLSINNNFMQYETKKHDQLAKRPLELIPYRILSALRDTATGIFLTFSGQFCAKIIA